MTLSITDPLAMVAIEAGLVQAPLRDEAADGDQDLSGTQRSAVLGEPIPIVFCRRDEGNSSGGVLVSPAATETRFSNDSSNAVTASYHLVVSEGMIGSIQVRDVLQGPCRRGSHTQTYNRRAGTWTPGNFITDVNRAPRRFWTTLIITPVTQSKINQLELLRQAVLTDPSQLTTYPFDFYSVWYEATLINPAEPDDHESWQYILPNGSPVATSSITFTKTIAPTEYDIAAPSFYCGSIGVYTGLSTLSFTVTTPNGSDAWEQQVHLFIRNGIEIPRLIEGTIGSSNNYADLVQWSLLNCANLPSTLIDATGLLVAANFLATNNFTCDLEIADSSNLSDFLAELAPYFLLAETRNNGQRGLRPLLPVNNDHTIRTTALSPVVVFTEDDIEAGSWEVEYVSLQDRAPVCVQVIWRQQNEAIPILRTSEVRYGDEAQDGPFEQHDLSAFCTRESHAVKVGAYIRARRRYVTHTARLQLRRLTTTLVPGDIVQVTLQRSAEGMNASVHSALYEIATISQSASGEVSLDLTHCPVDRDGRSMVALDVAAATASGIILPSNRTGESCDLNSAGDTTVPAEAGLTGAPLVPQWVMLGPIQHDWWKEFPPREPLDSLPAAGVFFETVRWDGTTLVIDIAMLPRNRAAMEGKGPLNVTITGSSVALSYPGELVNPQPASMPSINATVEVVREWSTYDASSSSPVPPTSERFVGQLRVEYSASDFPDCDMYYQMDMQITSWQGGFDDLNILNTGRAYFNWYVPSSGDVPPCYEPAIVYSQSSVLAGLQAATEAEMQNDTFKSNLQTATQIGYGPHWIQMDLGMVRPIVGIVVGALPTFWLPGAIPDADHFDPALFNVPGYGNVWPSYAYPGTDTPEVLAIRDTRLQASNDGVTWWTICMTVGRDNTGTTRYPAIYGGSPADWPVLHEYTTGDSPVPERSFFEYASGIPLSDSEYSLIQQDVRFAPRIPQGLYARYIRIYRPAQEYINSLSVTEFYVKVQSTETS
jgi:hypothetical protein